MLFNCSVLFLIFITAFLVSYINKYSKYKHTLFKVENRIKFKSISDEELKQKCFELALSLSYVYAVKVFMISCVVIAVLDL